MVRKMSSPQLALPLAHADKASFANFWSGRNSELVAALEKRTQGGESAAGSGTDHRVTYLYGVSGAGKSHLLFATVRHAKQLGGSNQPSYVSLSDSRVSGEMLSVINIEGLVCIDNIDAWAGDQTKERALFTLFEQIKHAGGALLVTASQPPSAAGFIIQDLVSRLGSGLLYPVYQLDDEERFFAIKLRADQRGLKIADDVVKYLLSRSSRDSRDLFAVLDRIDKVSLVEQRRITIPFLQGLLSR